jgi:hypothetical protein
MAKFHAPPELLEHDTERHELNLAGQPVMVKRRHPAQTHISHGQEQYEIVDGIIEAPASFGARLGLQEVYEPPKPKDEKKDEKKDKK